MKRLPFLICLVVTSIGSARNGEAVTLVSSCPAVLDVPGERYRLANDLSCGSGIAILITADDVDFSLDGHRISGPGTAGGDLGIGVSSVSGVKIRGGQVDNFDTGVVFEGTSDGLLIGVEVSDTLEGIVVADDVATRIIKNGVHRAAGRGINVTVSKSVEIDGNRVDNAAIGIGVNGDSTTPDNILIIRNVVSDSDRGIHLQNVNTNRVKQNDVFNCPSAIDLFDTANDVVERNTITDGGIGLGQVSGAQILNNSVSGANYGIVLSLGAPPSNNNTIRRNTTNDNNVGIAIIDGSGNLVQQNTSLGNGTEDMTDWSDECVNTWTANNFVTDSEGDGPGAGCIR